MCEGCGGPGGGGQAVRFAGNGFGPVLKGDLAGGVSAFWAGGVKTFIRHCGWVPITTFRKVGDVAYKLIPTLPSSCYF